MKMVIKLKSLHRLLCTLLLLCVGVTSILARSHTFYYAANAYVSPAQPTAGGKVYVNDEPAVTPTYQTTSTKTGSQYTVGYGETTLYLYAQAKDGFVFNHWASGSVSGEIVSTNRTFQTDIAYDSRSNSNPTTFNYYAVFTAQTGQIKVKSANENLGGVSIDKPNNQMGDVVELKATPDVSNGVMFYGWKKQPEGGTPEDGPIDGYYSKDNPLVLTANSETKGTYWAYFSEPAEKVYIRLKNNKTGKFLSFYGNAKPSTHTRDYSSYSNIADGFKFEGSLKMISPEEAQGNPNTVFLRSGHSQATGVTVGVDISTSNMAFSTLTGKSPITKNNYVFTIEGSGSSVRIYTTYRLTINGNSTDLPTYLCDEGKSYPVMKTIRDLSGTEQSAAEWTLYSLDETTTEGAFGANTKAKFTKGGKYYTTMYTDFPYQLLDGVNAYYLVFDENFTEITDRVVFKQVTGNKVAAYTAVILECDNVQNDINSTTTVTNRLLPLTDNFPSMTVNEGANFLKGYISVNGSSVANQDKFYVLSANKEGVLGFHPYSKPTMTPNKAYLDVRVSDQTVVEEHAKNVTFYFGEPEDNSEDVNPTGIELSDQIVDEDDSTPVYNLNGTKVAEGKTAEKMLRPGVYVKKGKKFVVK